MESPMSSESAKKAWVTRRKNIAARVARHNMAAVAAAQQNTFVTPDKGDAARKAWETRRQDEAERLEALAILDALAEQRRQAEEDNQPDDDGDFYSDDDDSE